jgi:hypothetical protein
MSSWDGPWSWHSLKGPEDKDKDGRRWLNPANQDFVPYGSFTDAELERWLNEDDEFLKPDKTFAQLKEYCEIGSLTGVYHAKELKQMHHTPAYLQSFSAAALKNQVNLDLLHEQYYSSKKRFNKHFIKELDGHVKAMIYDYFEYANVEKLLKNNFTVDREIQDKIYYFLQGLSHVGIGYWRYSNTPAERENFSYYKDFLIHEVLSEVYAKKRVRKYKDYYIDITKVSDTTYTSEISFEEHTFPYHIESSCPASETVDFTYPIRVCKAFIDSKDNKKFFTAFRKNPLVVSFAVIKEALHAAK